MKTFLVRVPPLLFSVPPLLIPVLPLLWCERTYSNQLSWPCYPSLPSLRYERDFQYPYSLGLHIAAFLTYSSTYLTHQTIQTGQPHDTLSMSPLPEFMEMETKFKALETKFKFTAILGPSKKLQDTKSCSYES